ncbi:MAG: polysaccharide pyruvyl transferase family protein [Chloroflexota bacterium]|nr:polysaccharide pyruvyl transferase family protein [Chloroflexota bacterium]
MSRAVVLGYQGFGNVGDEAILTGIEHLLDGVGIEVDAIISGPEPVAAFPDATRITTRRLRPSLAGIQALKRADLLLFSGGGLIHDHWPTVVPLYLGWSLLARLVGTRIAWVGVGIGPIRSARSRILAGRMLRLASLVTVRDAGSAQLAHTIAPGVPVLIGPDPALLNPPPSTRARSGIGVIVRAPVPRDVALTEDFAAVLGREVAILSAGSRPVTVLTLGGPGDRPFAETVRQRSQAAGADPSIEHLGPDPMAVLDRLASLEALITVRLHGLILGAVAGTPTLPVAYDDKVSLLAEQLGVGDICLDLARAISGPPGTLSGLLSVAQQPDRLRQTAARVSAIRLQSTALRRALEPFAG